MQASGSLTGLLCQPCRASRRQAPRHHTAHPFVSSTRPHVQAIPAAERARGVQDVQGSLGGGPSIHTMVAAMTPLLLLLAPDLEAATAQQLLAQGVSHMLQGDTSSIAFLLKVGTDPAV